LSPLLWNMVINFLLGRLNNESLWAQGFADDIEIVINEKFLSTVYELMQKALFIVHSWCRGVGLSVNSGLWKIVAFNKPILFGTELQLKNQVKYLGVILDKILTGTAILITRCRTPPLPSGNVEGR
jgi:hypothetical protein